MISLLQKTCCLISRLLIIFIIASFFVAPTAAMAASFNPTHVSAITDNAVTALDEPRGLFVSGNYAYVAGYFDKGVEILDISNPSNPTHIGAIFDDATTALNGAIGIFVSGNYAYVASYTENGVEILDISNPANPTHIGKIIDDANTALSGAYSVYVSGNYAYVASYLDKGVEILDISNPANPTHIGKIIDDANTELDGAWDIAVSGNYAYVTGFLDDGVEILDISNPANPTHIGKITDDAITALKSAKSIVVFAAYAYVTSYGEDGVEILDISNPANPTHIGKIIDDANTELDGAWDIAVFGNYGYVTGLLDDGVEILDISGINKGVPKILNYQGRLLDADGLPLGGEAGADYCFKFSIYGDGAVGAPDTKIWPVAEPSIMTANVVNGIFYIGIGDTAAGGDALDFNFQDTDSAYLNVEAATMVGGICGGGDEAFENLNPRQRILAAAYALNSDRLDGLNAISGGGASEYIPATNQYGNFLLNGAPQGAFVADSLLYLNSADTASANSLLGLAINGQEKFKINAGGDVFASGTLRTAGDIIVNGQSVCLANGTHCPAMGGGGWSDNGPVVYLTTASDRVVVGTSTAPLAKLNIYGDADEIQTMVKAPDGQTQNMSEWRNSSNELRAWVGSNGDIGTEGIVYASKLRIDPHSPAIEIFKDGALKVWIDGDGNMGASGTLNLDNAVKVKRYTSTDPIADKWTTYSTEDTKDVLQIMNNPNGFLDKIIDSKIVEYKKKANIDDEYAAALAEKTESEWLVAAELKKQAIENLIEEINRLADAGEDTAGLENQLAEDEAALQEFLSGEAEWKSAKKTELDSGLWSAQTKAELAAWKSALPKYAHSVYGLLADDPSTPKGFLTYDDDDNIIGLDLGGYAGFLNLALKEAAIRLKNLENLIAINDDGQVFTSSTNFGTIFAEALFINNIGASNIVNIQTASSTVFNIDAAGNSLFGPSVDSADALRVRNADNTEILFTVDTENNMVKIGDNGEAGSPTTIFVLDSKADAGDPAGTDGAMYYNSNIGKFRCYEGGAWKDCVNEGGAVAFRESYFTFFSEAKPVAF